MATAITEDFVTKNGIVVQGTSAVTSSTGQSNALQVDGGAGIAKNLIVGSTATIYGKLTVNNESLLNGSVTATGVVSITDSTAATTSSVAALVVTGGIYAGGNVIVANVNASTSTLVSNSLYVAGGVGIAKSLVVAGPAIFNNDVTFTGATTYVFSTNTVYTDNLIELHTTGTPEEWTVNDGKDIGVRFHYFGTTGSNAALVLANDTKYLEWYVSGAESNTGTFSSATYGTFKTSSIRLVSTETAVSTITGALQVVGGIGVGGTIYSGSNISGDTLTARNLTLDRVVLAGPGGLLTDFSGLTYSTVTNFISARVTYSNTATDLAGGATGSLPYQTNTGTTGFIAIAPSGYVLLSQGGIPTWSTFAEVTSGLATTASNIAAGADTYIPYQNGVGTTAFEYNFRYDYSFDTLRTVNAVFTGTESASSTITGAVQVVGGLGIGQDLFVGGNEIIVGDIEVRGGDITTNQSTFNLLDTTAATINFAGSATAITIGATSGTTTVRNVTNITNAAVASSINSGALRVTGGVGIIGSLYVGSYSEFAVSSGLLYPSYSPTAFFKNSGSLTSAISLKDSDNNGVNIISNAASLIITSNSTEIIKASTTAVIVPQSTISTSTNSGALQVVGGAGIGGSLYVGNNSYVGVNSYIVGNENITGNLVIDGGNLDTTAATFNLLNTTATTVNFAGSGTAITIGAETGYVRISSNGNASSTITGALQVIGGIGVGNDLFVGGNQIILGDIAVRGGDITTNQTTFNLINDTASIVNFAGAGTAITIGTTTGYTEIKNATTVTSTVVSSSTTTGALTVVGGVGIRGRLNVGGSTVLNALNATVTTATTLTVIGTANVNGALTAAEGSNATLINNGALRVTGGVGITRDLVIGGLITAAVTQSLTTGTTVSGFLYNNTLLASFTSNVITGSGQVTLDTFASTLFRSAKYFIQIVDGANVQISEISLFHDGVKAYLSEYGISTNNGQLGAFDATWDASNVSVKFTPISASAMTIKMTRSTLTL